MVVISCGRGMSFGYTCRFVIGGGCCAGGCCAVASTAQRIARLATAAVNARVMLGLLCRNGPKAVPYFGFDSLMIRIKSGMSFAAGDSGSDLMYAKRSATWASGITAALYGGICGRGGLCR